MIPVPRARMAGETDEQRMDYLASFVPKELLDGFHTKIMSLAKDEAEAERQYEMTLLVFGAALVWADEQYRKVS